MHWHVKIAMLLRLTLTIAACASQTSSRSIAVAVPADIAVSRVKEILASTLSFSMRRCSLYRMDLLWLPAASTRWSCGKLSCLCSCDTATNAMPWGRGVNGGPPLPLPTPAAGMRGSVWCGATFKRRVGGAARRRETARCDYGHAAAD